MWSCRNMSGVEVCGRPRDRGAARLSPPQLSRLLEDRQVREEVQDVSFASLLPPVGAEVFRRFTLSSAKEAEQHGHRQTGDEHLDKPADQLRVGEPLPFFYGAPPTELLYTPLEELDPYYQSQKTFLVLSRGNILHRFDADSSLFLLSPFNPLRTISIRILLSLWFQLFILFTLLINCLLMTIIDKETKIMEFIFISIYSFEVLLKVLASGFCLGRFSFIRDSWNWMDLLVLLPSIPALFLDLGKFSVFVTIPRILKVVSASPALRRTAGALLRSLRRFVDVLVVAALGLGLLAIISTQLFMGRLRNKCVLRMDANFSVASYFDFLNPNGSHSVYARHVLNPGNHFYRPSHLDALVCGNISTAGGCPDGYTCLWVGNNPNYGFTSYDSFFWSLLSMFRLLTQDFWENLYQLTLRSSGADVAVFFFLLVLPTYFLVFSLLLAVVAMVTVDQDKVATDRKKQREEEFRKVENVLMRKMKEEEELAGVVVPSGHTPLTLTEANADGRPSSFWQLLRFWLRPLVSSPYFDLGVVVCLIFNIVVMATECYPMTEQHVVFLSASNLVFTGIFVVELLLRMSVLGFRGFFQVSWHILDFLVVISSLLELSLADISGLSVLRCLRLLRMLRLARWWPSLLFLLHLVRLSVQTLSLVLLVLLFMWTMVGLQLFEQDYVHNVCRISTDCMQPRWHMVDLAHTIMVVFRVLCGEWIECLWDCMEVSGPGTCAAYFIPQLLIGKLLVLFLFMNLLLNSSTKDQLAALEDRLDQQKQTMIRLCGWTGQNRLLDPHHRRTPVTCGSDGLTPVTCGSDGLTPVTSGSDGLTPVTSGSDGLTPVTCGSDGLTPVTSGSDGLTPVTSGSDLVHKVPVSSEQDYKDCPSDVEEMLEKENDRSHTAEDCYCSCCPLQDGDSSQASWTTCSDFRRICLLIVENKVFEGFMLFIILLSSMTLVFEDVHLQTNPVLVLVLDWADLVFTLLFLLEMLLKCFGFGLKKYFSDVFCWLDFLVLDASLLALVLQAVGVSCRPVRALRTLRIPSRFQGVRVVLRSLLVTLPAMLDVGLVTLFVWLMFGILGVNLFGGKFFYCFNRTSEEFFHFTSINNRSDCLAVMNEGWTEVQWKKTLLHFDNVAASYLSLLVLGTSRGLMDLLYMATDSRGVDLQPEYEHSLSSSLYFLFFFIFGCFFTFLHFITSLLRALQRHQQELGGKHLFITEQQQIYPEGFRKRLNTLWRCPLPQNACQSRLFALVTSVWFEVFMMVVICVDVVLLGCDSLEISSETLNVTHFFHLALILVFLLEFILKITAFRRFYFHSALNMVDFIVLILSIVGVFVADLMEKYFLRIRVLELLRLVRLVRVVRFCEATRGIRMLLLGFVMSLPALLNISFLLLVVTYSFSVVGMFCFGHARELLIREAFMMDDMVNFETFWSSLVTMTMVTPSSSWDGLLMDILDTPPDRWMPGSEVRGDCASPEAGIVFFTSYILLFILLLVHLFIAVILESFNARNMEDSEDPQDHQDHQEPQDPQNPQDPENLKVSD